MKNPSERDTGNPQSSAWTFRSTVPRLAMRRPRTTLAVLGAITLLLGALFPLVQIDTDPENMLPSDHEARVQNDAINDRFFLHDMIGVGIEPSNADGRLSVEDLQRVHDLVQLLERTEGVVSYDILSVYTSDDIQGEFSF